MIRLLGRDDRPTRIRKENVEIWTSQKNFAYQKTADFHFNNAIEPSEREVRDYFGAIVTRKGDPIRVLSLEGLSLQDPYILVATNFQDSSGDFAILPTRCYKHATGKVLLFRSSSPTVVPFGSHHAVTAIMALSSIKGMAIK